MPTNLLEKIKLFQLKTDNFIEILSFFNSKIKYLSYKLKYPEASTDLIIYLHQLITKLDFHKFNSDEEIIRYIKKCLENKSIKLSYNIKLYNNAITFHSDIEISNLIDRYNIPPYEYSDLLFNDLISSLKPKQKQILFLKFYLQLSDIEIAKILKISRQAVNKAEKVSLKKLKSELFKEVNLCMIN